MSARSKLGQVPVSADQFYPLAVRLHETYGWSILPVKNKKPNVKRWQRFQDVAPCAKELADMFSVPGSTGLAVVAGPVSDGLIVRDFDQVDAYHRWAAEHPDIAVSLPTIETARGFHTLCRSPGVQKITVQGDGELRGKGVSLLPTSYHPSGQRYRWLVQPGAQIPLVADPVWAGLVNVTYTDTCHEFVGSAPPRAERVLPRSVEEAVASTLPTGPGERNLRLFDLALGLKCLDPNLSPAVLRKIVADWHQQALPVIRTKSFQVTMQDFIHAWNAVASAPLAMLPIVERARQMQTPIVARHYNEPTQLLVRVCALLQEQWQDRPFFMSSRKAADIMGTDTMTAWRALQELQFDQILRLESMGTLKGRRASQWRYVAPM